MYVLRATMGHDYFRQNIQLKVFFAHRVICFQLILFALCIVRISYLGGVSTVITFHVIKLCVRIANILVAIFNIF